MKIGKRFGRLTVVSKTTVACWETRCDCGESKTQVAKEIKNGDCSVFCPFKSRGFFPGEAGLRDLYRRYRKDAAKDEKLWELNEEEFRELTSGNCYYCGDSPKNISTYYKRDQSQAARTRAAYIYNGIDRLNNQEGYKVSNCVTACSTCNYLKGQLPEGQFLKQLEKIYKNKHSKCKK